MANVPVTAEGIRSAMFSRTRQLFDVDLMRSPDGSKFALVVTPDVVAPAHDAAAHVRYTRYMRKLAGIANVANDLGVGRRLLMGIDALPVDGPSARMVIMLGS